MRMSRSADPLSFILDHLYNIRTYLSHFHTDNRILQLGRSLGHFVKIHQFIAGACMECFWQLFVYKYVCRVGFAVTWSGARQ